MIFQDTSFISAEPETTIAGGIAAHYDITRHAETLFGKGFYRFQRLGIHLDDSTVITANPVVALMVFGDSVYITDVQAYEV